MLIAAGSKLVMIGDSITDAGRAQPVGEGLGGAYGGGYVNLINGLLGSNCPEQRIRVVNVGCSGHNVRDLKGRWERDVLNLNPDWVSVMIGINDVWRQFDLPLQPECHVYLPEYEKTLDELVRGTLPSVKGIVLMTPFFIEPRRQDAMRATMDRYGAVVRKLARRHGTLLVDTQAAYDKVLKHTPSAALAWDRVHPNTAGHLVLARAFLNAVEFKW